MREGRLKKALKVIVPLCITVAMIAWLIHKADIHKLRVALEQPVDYTFIALMMLLTVGSHMIRGIRWGIQLRAAGIPRIPVLAEGSSILGAYALNVVFPYLGEAWRCVYIARRENAKITTVVGTDIGDRISDLIVIIMITALTFAVAHPAMTKFFDMLRNYDVHFSSTEEHRLFIVLIAVVAILVILWLLLRRRKGSSFMAGALRMWRGFAVLFHMKGTGEYILLTFGIWICYFLQTYFCMFAFPYTRELITNPVLCHGLIPALVVFVFGSCSMCIPSNGGLGPWNIAVVLGLSLYGIDTASATAWSLVYWSWQTVAQFAGGLFALLYISHERRNQKISQKG